MSSHWKAILGVILIFVFGWVAGVLCTSLYLGHKANEMVTRGPEVVAEFLERRLTEHIDLDASQKAQIHELFLESARERRQLQVQLQPQVRQLNWQTYRQIYLVLRPDQQEIFRQNLAAFRKRFEKYALNPNGDTLPSPETQPGNPAGNSGTNGT